MFVRRTAALSLALLATLLTLPAAHAATRDIQVGGAGTVYSPSTVTIQVGDTVRWSNAGGTHNVHADDNSFQCSNSCANGNNSPSGSAWVATHTFNVAGTFRYYCDLHGGPGGSGMSGTVVVQGAPTVPGSFRFSPATYSAGEASGSVTVHVSRDNGADGAVTVRFAATGGTATPGADFTATSGTLNWADQDSAEKTFQVTILDDNLTESDETINLTLSNPSGGATISNAGGAITIVDDDAPAPTPAAPTNLTATGVTATDIQLAWKDNSNNESSFKIESKTGAAAFSQIAASPPNSTGATITGLAAATAYTFRVRAGNGAGNSIYSNEATASTLGDTTPCVAGPNTLCLGSGGSAGRFKVEVSWSSASSGGQAIAVPLASAPQSGLFYFVDPTNIEMLVKVINACIPLLGNKYWVFFAATTNVQFSLRVTDTRTGQSKTYANALDHPASPVQDTDAFSTCP